MPLFLHPVTARAVEHLARALPQSLLLEGDEGVGLATIAKQLAGDHLAAYIEPKDKDGHIDHQRGTISIETIRELYVTTRGRQTQAAIIIIDDADRMSHGAQNAFLKLLEEPGAHTYFILTSHHARQLLATILSRVQQQTMLPVTPAQTDELLATQGAIDTRRIAQLKFIASGLPAELSRLVADNEYFDKRAIAMGDARTFIQGSSFERLVVAFRYSTQRDKALQLLDSALVILRRSVSTQPEPRLVTQLEQTLAAREAIDANHHVRLQLTQLII